MSHCSNHFRAFSKPTNEVQILSQQVATCSYDQLNSIVQAAIAQSPEVVRVIAKILAEAQGNRTQPSFQSVQHQIEVPSTLDFDNGPLTPNETSSEDSEMSGTEHVSSHYTSNSTTQFSAQLPPRRSNKRKSLADRDDTLSLVSPRAFAHGKRRRPELPSGMRLPSNPDERTDCGNCGRSVPQFCWSQPHACVYHSGIFQKKNAVLAAGFGLQSEAGNWSCCGNAFASRGCMTTKHRLVDPQGSGSGAFGYSAKLQQTQFCDLYQSGRLPLLQ